MSDSETVPAGLGERGARFWRSTMVNHDPSPGETEVLIELCRTLDQLNAMDEMVASEGPQTRGAAGQPVVNPAIGASISLRTTMHRLMSALRIDEEGIQTAQTTRARTAANASWRGHTPRAKAV